MMDVQLMRDVVDDVERGVLPDIAQEAARRWCGQEGLGSLTYVRSSANHLFRFEQEGHPRFLRLAHEAERRPSTIEAELDFVRHVASTGLAVARPLESMHGQLIEEVSNNGQRYCAVVFEGLQGRQVEVDDLDLAGYRTWGRALALVHAASADVSCASRLPQLARQVARILTARLEWLDTLALRTGFALEVLTFG